MAPTARNGARDTRAAIVEAAMRGFGEKGFAATSTREIAAMAGTNIASIAYHFGGKEGLRAACADRVVELMRGALAATEQSPLPADPAAAERLLETIMRAMSGFLLLQPQARLIAGFMLREMAEPSKALDLIYDGLIEGVHRRVCMIWGRASGREPESETVRLAVFALIGQILYFHIGRPIVERRMGWESTGPAEVEAIAATITRNLVTRLEADRSMA
jgi:AcrR family transcriptional regulator